MTSIGAREPQWRDREDNSQERQVLPLFGKLVVLILD